MWLLIDKSVYLQLTEVAKLHFVYSVHKNMKFCHRSSRRKVFCKVFLEISQSSEENTCASVSFLIKLQLF